MLLLAKFFGRFLKHHKRLIPGILCVPASWWLDIKITLVIGAALNRLETDDPAFLNKVLWILIGLAIGRGFFRYLQRWWIVTVSRRVEVEIKQDIFNRLTELALAFHDRHRTGDIASRVTSDVEAIRMLLGPGMMYVLGTVVAVSLSIDELLALDAKLTLILAVPLAILAVSVMLLMPSLHKSSLAVQERIADVSHRAQENFGGIRVVKGYGLEQQQEAIFERASRANHDAQLSLATARGLVHTFTRSSHDLCFVPILFVGGAAVMGGSLAIGDLFIFIDLVLKVFWPVLALGWIAGMYPRAAASARRIEELLGDPTELERAAAPVAIERARGAFRLRDVGYRYEGADEPALAAIDLDVPAGTTLGVVGPTGAGKTTFLHLFERLYEATGTIELDGRPLADYDLTTLRRAAGHVTQDAFLFSASYADNLAFGADDPLEEGQAWELLEVASIADEVRDFPDGLEQLIGERGVNLSGGQRQRTSIARALASDPPILILDDALSAVDTHTEKKLLEHLADSGEERTVIVAAHRLSVVQSADQILVLEQGRPSALGSHAELLEASPWYRDAWNRQQAQDELEGLE